MVTGVIQLKNGPPTHFVQTFFLAVQPNGYFILNDVLRFLEISTTHKNSVPRKFKGASGIEICIGALNLFSSVVGFSPCKLPVRLEMSSLFYVGKRSLR